MKPPDDDYSLRYSWTEGSIPPPHHYEYDILFDSTGNGSVAMIPDYPGQDVPCWTEPFAVAPDAARDLLALMVSEGLLTRKWRAVPRPPVGGSHAWLTVTAAGRQIKVPPFPLKSQQEHAAKIFVAVRALVPQSVWDKLDAQRQLYIQGHQG